MTNLKQSLAPEIPPECAVQANQPRAQRKKQMLFPAICCYGEGKYKLECTIRDLSQTGVRISFSRASQLAPSVQLINVRDMLVYDATVAWKTVSEAGLEISRTRAMSEITGPENAYLRRYWFERAMR